MASHVARSAEVVFAAVLLVVLVLLLGSMVLDRRPDARMEFLLNLMKDFPRG